MCSEIRALLRDVLVAKINDLKHEFGPMWLFGATGEVFQWSVVLVGVALVVWSPIFAWMHNLAPFNH